MIEGGFVNVGESAPALRALLAQLLVEHGGTVLVRPEATAAAVALGDVHIVARREAGGMRVSIGGASLASADELARFLASLGCRSK